MKKNKSKNLIYQVKQNKTKNSYNPVKKYNLDYFAFRILFYFNVHHIDEGYEIKLGEQQQQQNK